MKCTEFDPRKYAEVLMLEGYGHCTSLEAIETYCHVFASLHKLCDCEAFKKFEEYMEFSGEIGNDDRIAMKKGEDNIESIINPRLVA